MHSPVRPFLKWAGNKYGQVERLRRSLPVGRRLVEPFVGSGAVFLNTDFDEYLLADSSADLILLYRILQAEGEPFIEACRPFFDSVHNAPLRFYAYREEFNDDPDPHRRAALFLYLNRHGYNGLCRYNARGEFNVPFGRHARPYFPEREMRAFFLKAHRAIILPMDFRGTMRQARADDVVYCDPPYAPLSRTSDFTDYNGSGFRRADQLQLAQEARRLAARGIPVLISNHDTPFVRDAYAEARIDSFEVRRNISCKTSRRGKALELLAGFGTAWLEPAAASSA